MSGASSTAGRCRTPGPRSQRCRQRTAASDALSKDLKARGFSFVGSTICYAHMQATGMVNDHVVSCFRHRRRAAPGRVTAGALPHPAQQSEERLFPALLVVPAGALPQAPPWPTSRSSSSRAPTSRRRAGRSEVPDERCDGVRRVAPPAPRGCARAPECPAPRQSCPAAATVRGASRRMQCGSVMQEVTPVRNIPARADLVTQHVAQAHAHVGHAED